MAGEINYDVQTSADMDYPEHERTYARFLAMFKWGAVFVVALLVGMAVGLLGAGSVLGGIGAFVVVLAIAYFIFR
ncbi:aa3-type cytochrome c oxidase subunit IV [Fulvimarina endophytica]|uniref:Aa3-type cytochrome c oxidase subunit IV n=1 Tax=Fulvimarina endophytica TaxID=2293836 RepID=A0A371X8F6_9HYPH|nr:aa3-type cytochrome c oxidase subunit IV [Fulvimarina endophytica]RFC65513.1 aa3-type cytochrome c oxidase subunit IV [Fulvimarina endophytica]